MWITVPLLFFQGYRMVNMIFFLRNNMEGETALKNIQQLGSYHGKILVLLGLVWTILLGLGNRNVRRIQHYYAKNNYLLCKKYLKDDIKQFVIIWVVLSGVLLLGGEKLLQTIFQKTSPTELRMLQIGCVGILFSVIAIYLYRILTLMKKESMIAISSFAGFVLQTVFMVMLVKIPELGIVSVISAEVIFWGVTALMETVFVLRLISGKKMPFEKSF